MGSIMSNLKAAPVQRGTFTHLIDQGNILEICWPDGSSRFHSIWLRDNGQDDKTRNPSNFQKLITLQDIPKNSTIRAATINTSNQLELTFAPDGWTTCLDLDWLWQHRYDCFANNRYPLIPDQQTNWDAAFTEKLPTVKYDDAKENPEILLQYLLDIDRYGVARMEGIPAKNAGVLDVIALFGYIRETNYGKYFEIRSEINPINLANTADGLQSHTDNPYRNPTPGLQLFGCLENNADGGDSIVVDGFKIAERIHNENPEWFDLLSKYNAQFEFKGGDDVHLISNQPMIALNPHGQITEIHFNNRSCDTLTDIPFEDMEAYYCAYRRFGELANSPELEVRFKMEPQQLFITDNTRVLHGRTGFSGAGNRWMQGAYADKDSLQSKIRILKNRLRK